MDIMLSSQMLVDPAEEVVPLPAATRYDGKARFSVVPLPKVDPPEGMFLATTRRGKQFNSMVHERRDALTGALREAVLISRPDAERLASPTTTR
jgi:hypothetical protein